MSYIMIYNNILDAIGHTPLIQLQKMVTPDMAQEWLRRNASSNRKLRPQNVRGIAEDIKHGAWTIDNNNICFCYFLFTFLSI